MSGPRKKKSLLIGINYTGSQHALNGCHQDIENIADFLSYRGYRPEDQVILRDDRPGLQMPTGQNIIRAFDWLVSDPGTCNFLHYSGHGGQVQDPTGRHPTGLLDTIVPVDYESTGQISSDFLHKHLISALPPNSTLFVILDCCHSGSALELPYVYRSDDNGNISLIDNLKEGAKLFAEGADIMSGPFDGYKLAEAEDLYAGATNFFRSWKHRNDPTGLGGSDYQGDYQGERKTVTMFSGCRDDQTSADANIGGRASGAMTWAFLESMRKGAGNSYISTLQETRYALRSSNYDQVPQLSVGWEIDLEEPLIM
jgi:metacaspase-1